METFIAQLRKFYPLSDGAIHTLLQHLEEAHFLKGEHATQEEHHDNNVYFIKKGFARVYVIRDVKEITLWFASEGEMLTGIPYRSTTLNAEITEDSTLLKISYPYLENLFGQSLELANWGRKLVEHYLAEYERYFAEYSWTNAKAQYDSLLKEYPDLFQKIPLKHIASYLQITPQSLSRIRAKK